MVKHLPLYFNQGHNPEMSRFPHHLLIIVSLLCLYLKVFFSLFFRFFCQHFANIPKVGGHALYYGQDPSTWSPPSTAFCRLRVSFSQMVITSSCYCCAILALDLQIKKRQVKCECAIFCFYDNSSFDLCFPGFALRPEGTRMIQVMLLKSLVQVRF